MNRFDWIERPTDRHRHKQTQQMHELWNKSKVIVDCIFVSNWNAWRWNWKWVQNVADHGIRHVPITSSIVGWLVNWCARCTGNVLLNWHRLWAQNNHRHQTRTPLRTAKGWLIARVTLHDNNICFPKHSISRSIFTFACVDRLNVCGRPVCQLPVVRISNTRAKTKSNICLNEERQKDGEKTLTLHWTQFVYSSFEGTIKCAPFGTTIKSFTRRTFYNQNYIRRRIARGATTTKSKQQNAPFTIRLCFYQTNRCCLLFTQFK